MAYAITSEDIIAICLLLVDFDPEIGIGEVIRRAEEYQKSESGNFGESEWDFRMAFFWLGLELGWIKLEEALSRGPWKLSGVPLKEWIIPLLTHYQDIYFNDEGEHWTALPEECKRPNVPKLSGGQRRDQKLRDVSEQRRQLMKKFFSDPANSQTEKISEFLCLLGWRKELLLYYFFPGMIYEGKDVPLEWGYGNTIRWRYVPEDSVTDKDL